MEAIASYADGSYVDLPSDTIMNLVVNDFLCFAHSGVGYELSLGVSSKL